MKNELWNQVSELFQSALKLERRDRTLYLKNACADNDELHRHVNSLLEAYESADGAGFIDAPAIGRVARLLIEEKTIAGELVGHYKIVKRLGAGGMGEVYLADDTMLKRPVAIKVLLAETAQDKDRIHRFVQEARAASALNHPNILTVYQVGDYKESRFIATEYIKGETLREKLAQGPLELLVVLDIAAQVAAALETAHAAGIIHRDIKPENIMVRDDGLVKVLDFGLAKLSEMVNETEEVRIVGLESETRDHFHTRAGTIMGTAAYMSPQQARGLHVDARTDIWSVGVLIFEMVTGKQPFGGDTLNDTIAAILKTEPERSSDIPAEVDKIVSKALKKDVDERYQLVKDLLTDLREFKQDLEFAIKLGMSDSPPKATDSRSVALTGLQNRTTVSSAEYIAREIKNHKFAFVGGPLILVLALSISYYLASGIVSKNASNAEIIDSIAVLPFVNESGNADIEYLSDGMTDSLINSLSQLPNLLVKARSSVFQYKGKEVSPQVIGTELTVKAALFGHVTQRNDLLTLSLELVDTKSGNRIWGELYSRKQSDLLSLQSEVTRDVANKLGARLSGTQEQHATKADTADPGAYKLYLQGLYHLNKRTAEDLRTSITLFEQAIQKDPGYAKAYASLAMSSVILRVYSAKLTQNELNELGTKRDAAVLRAQELDDSLPEVHAMLATSYEDAWDFAAADIEYRRAIQLNPNFSSVHAFYSLSLALRARYEEAIDEINKAYELDPFSRSIAFNIGARFADARRFDEAIAQYKRVLEMEPDHPLTHSLLAQVFDAKGLYVEAIAEYRRANVLLEKESAETADREATALTHALKTRGPEGYWQKRLEFAEADGQAYRVAIVYARLGDRDRAFEQLQKAFASREIYLRWIRTESAFDSMTDDPRFVDLVHRLGLVV
jgi:serine/threonine protein kinase